MARGYSKSARERSRLAQSIKELLGDAAYRTFKKTGSYDKGALDSARKKRSSTSKRRRKSASSKRNPPSKSRPSSKKTRTSGGSSPEPKAKDVRQKQTIEISQADRHLDRLSSNEWDSSPREQRVNTVVKQMEAMLDEETSKRSVVLPDGTAVTMETLPSGDKGFRITSASGRPGTGGVYLIEDGPKEIGLEASLRRAADQAIFAEEHHGKSGDQVHSLVTPGKTLEQLGIDTSGGSLKPLNLKPEQLEQLEADELDWLDAHALGGKDQKLITAEMKRRRESKAADPPPRSPSQDETIASELQKYGVKDQPSIERHVAALSTPVVTELEKIFQLGGFKSSLRDDIVNLMLDLKDGSDKNHLKQILKDL